MAFRREQFFHGLTPIYPSLGKQISLPVFLLFPLIFPFSPSRAPPSSNYAVIFFLIVIHHQVPARWKPAISRVSKRDKSNLSDTIKSFDARCPLLFSLFFFSPLPSPRISTNLRSSVENGRSESDADPILRRRGTRGESEKDRSRSITYSKIIRSPISVIAEM